LSCLPRMIGALDLVEGDSVARPAGEVMATVKRG
jgi:hypothetical protein